MYKIFWKGKQERGEWLLFTDQYMHETSIERQSYHHAHSCNSHQVIVGICGLRLHRLMPCLPSPQPELQLLWVLEWPKPSFPKGLSPQLSCLFGVAVVFNSPLLLGKQVPSGSPENSLDLRHSLLFFFKCHISFFKIFIYFILFIYLFMAVLGLRFCARAFPSCGKRGPHFIAVHGPLTIAASLVAEHRLQTRRLSSCGSRT